MGPHVVMAPAVGCPVVAREGAAVVVGAVPSTAMVCTAPVEGAGVAWPGASVGARVGGREGLRVGGRSVGGTVGARV